MAKLSGRARRRNFQLRLRQSVQFHMDALAKAEAAHQPTAEFRKAMEELLYGSRALRTLDNPHTDVDPMFVPVPRSRGVGRHYTEQAAFAAFVWLLDRAAAKAAVAVRPKDHKKKSAKTRGHVKTAAAPLLKELARRELPWVWTDAAVNVERTRQRRVLEKRTRKEDERETDIYTVTIRALLDIRGDGDFAWAFIQEMAHAYRKTKAEKSALDPANRAPLRGEEDPVDFDDTDEPDSR